jgi:vacuolar-type H+-ATPase subunit I/STV1
VTSAEKSYSVPYGRPLLSTLTKIFIFLQLICSIAVAVVLVFGLSRLQNYRADVDSAEARAVAAQAAYQKSQNDIAVAQAQAADAIAKATGQVNDLSRANNDLTTKNAQLQSQIGALEARNAQQQNSISQLTSSIDSQNSLLAAKDKELAELRPENASLIQKNAELNRVNNELSTQQRFAEQAIRKLQEQIAQAGATGGGAAAPAEGQGGQVASLTSSASGAINGKINQVTQSAGHTLIEIPLGDRDGVKVNTRFTIYRNNGYVGDAVVQKVFPDSSVAQVTVVKPGDSVKQGDLVTTGVQ